MADNSTKLITFRLTGVALNSTADGERRERGVRPAAPGRGEGALLQSLSASTDEQNTDIVSIKIVGGPELRLHPDNARLLMHSQAGNAGPGAARGDNADVVNVPTRLAWTGDAATRGDVAGVALEWFKVITGGGSAARASALTLAKVIDERVDEGLYRLGQAPFGSLKGQPPINLSNAQVPGPILIFVHGTFSSTAGSFSDLWTSYPLTIAKLIEHYRGQVYGFDHYTLSKSPEQNALDLYRVLPKNATVHLVTHSRGGLVGEVLARSSVEKGPAFTAADIKQYVDSKKPQPIIESVNVFNDLVAQSGARIARVVRAACPAFGTTLASDRLDAYLSVLSWGLKSASVPLAPDVINFLDAVARERTNADVLPGIESMRPGSTSVTVLNAHDVRVQGDLRVIAGDLQGDTVWSWVKQLMSDAFYWEDNDVVVQTRSMYGGSERVRESSYLLDRSGTTNHFSYFKNERTANAMRDALLLDGLPPGFRNIGPQSFAGKDSTGARGAPLVNSGTRPLVIVLPGIMGSNLKRTVDASSDREWFNTWRIVGALSRLRLPDNDAKLVSPDGSISMYYSDLQQFLNRDFDVIDFSYDWRLSIRDAAKALGEAVIKEVKARLDQKLPVSLLAHSMGGLVIRAMEFEHPAAWSALLAQQAKWNLVMLGTPNGGSYAPMQALTGDAGSVVSAVESVGVNPFGRTTAREVVAGFVGLLELQADLQNGAQNLGKQSTWQKLRQEASENSARNSPWHDAGRSAEALDWGVPTQSTLDDAVGFRAQLDKQISKGALTPAPIKLVLGRAPSTPTGILVNAMGYAYATTTEGDGRVTWASAQLPGVQTWIVPCVHGDLSAASEHFPAYRDLLLTGTTKAIDAYSSASLINTGRGGTLGAGVVNGQPRLPDLFDLLADSRGPSDDDTTRNVLTRPRVNVAVYHGDVRFVEGALLVGHYSGSELTGSESALNSLLDGSLQRSLSAGLYPSAVGSTDIFMNRNHGPLLAPRPRCVIVAGLGLDGVTRAAQIRVAVRQAALAYARMLGDAATDLLAAPSGNGFTLHSVCIGSGSGVSVPESVLASIEGAQDAAEMAAREGWPQIDTLRFIEVYGNRASEILQTVRQREKLPDAGFTVSPSTLVVMSGHRRRQPGLSYRSANYDLISVTAELKSEKVGEVERKVIDELEFSMWTQRSRSEVRGKAVQPALMASLVQSAENNPDDNVRLGSTLFKLLIPLELQTSLQSSSAVVLDLDAPSAGFPWEFLDDRENPGIGNTRPLAVRVPLLRRLKTSEFRSNPHDNANSNDQLVIGVPLLSAGYAELPGAEREAVAVAGILGTKALLHASALQVVATLLTKAWKVVHVCGHGGLGDGRHTGVVLDGGCFLGPREIESMTTVPELVFVNCCFLGKISDEPNAATRTILDQKPLFASSVAEALIGLGVRCVVAAGWAVDDTVATVFAEAFYGSLKDGFNFRDSVQVARRAAFDSDPSGNTWAAYQCYGDANWRLVRPDSENHSGHYDPASFDPLSIGSADDLLLHLDAICADAAVEIDQGPLRDKLQRLETSYGALWGNIGRVAEGFGRAYRDLGLLEPAATWLSLAVATNDGTAPLKAWEQRLNVQTRLIADSDGSAGAMLTAQEKADRVAKLVTLAAEAQAFVEGFPTAERWSIFGSIFKRIALLSDGEERKVALREMRAAYEMAFETFEGKGSNQRFYPAMQCVAATLAVGHLSDEDRQCCDKWLAASQSALGSMNSEDPDFWSLIGGAERAILQSILAGGDLAPIQNAAVTISQIQSAHRRKHEWRSVRTNFDFLLGALDGRNDLPKAVLLDLARLRDVVAGFS